jgi:hypothetical protein
MTTHRFLDQLGDPHNATSGPAGIVPGAFMVCPLVLCPAFAGPLAAWQQQVYQVAFEQAQAAAHLPAQVERDLFAIWN